MKPLIEIKPLLNGEPQKVVVTMHQNPDADAMGSSLALKLYLEKKGHQVVVVSPNDFPDFLKWMDGCSDVIVFDQHQDEAVRAIKEATLIFGLDFNGFHRSGGEAGFLKEAQATKALIDHHIDPLEDEFDFGISDTSAASATLLVYEFIVAMDDFDMIDLPMSQCIYAGTMTDTGSFRFPSTSSRVHRMVAELMDLGLDHEAIHRAIYDNFRESRLRFIGDCLLNKMEVLYEYKTAFISVDRATYQKYKLVSGDTEGLVNYPLSIKGIQVAALFTDRKGEVRISLRSKGEVNVNILARQYFNGGGHKNAAGGRMSESLEETVAIFKKAIKENNELITKQ